LVISIGICASVSNKWLSVLGLTSSGVLITFYFLNNLMMLTIKKPLFIASFSEGNSLNILEIESSKQIEELMQHNNIVSFQKHNDNYTYRLASSNKDSLIKISSFYSNDSDINSISYSDF
jgi:hypothetical protein